MNIEIVGYEQEGECEHCGRPLKHCIRIDDGRIVGATCLANKMTKAKVYNGRKYRVHAEDVIKAAKLRARYTLQSLLARGYSHGQFTFEAV
jgi:predicted amidophosphoribosyltransferase